MGWSISLSAGNLFSPQVEISLAEMDVDKSETGLQMKLEDSHLLLTAGFLRCIQYRVFFTSLGLNSEARV